MNRYSLTGPVRVLCTARSIGGVLGGVGQWMYKLRLAYIVIVLRHVGIAKSGRGRGERGSRLSSRLPLSADVCLYTQH